jgi:hypothetical protein
MSGEVRQTKYGTREEVFNGLASKTRGNLSKEDIVFEGGKYKSKRAIERGHALINQMRDRRDGGVSPQPEPVPAVSSEQVEQVEQVEKKKRGRKPKVVQEPSNT